MRIAEEMGCPCWAIIVENPDVFLDEVNAIWEGLDLRCDS
jgi:hypothetical protein